MKNTVVTYTLLLVIILAKANGVPQAGKDTEKEKQPRPGILFPNLNGPLTIQRIREEFPHLIRNVTSVDWEKAPGGLGLGAIYNTLLSGVHSLYQDLLNRQQAFINLLTCGNCVNDGWNAIMEVVTNVPELEWVYRPNSEGPASFFTAVYQNGTVTGIGGSIVNDKPVAEYAFGNDGIAQHLPDRDKRH